MGIGVSRKSTKVTNAKKGQQAYAYSAEVFTSDNSYWRRTGTDDDVYLTLQGTNGATRRILLDKRWYDDLEAGSRDVYEIEGSDIGELQYLTLERYGKDTWHLDKVIIVHTATNTRTCFPFYDWVEGVVKLRPAQALLIFQEKSEDMKKARREETINRREMYPYGKSYGLQPGFIGIEGHDNLPRFVQFHDVKKHDFKDNVDEAKRKFGISTLLEKMHTWDRPEQLANIAKKFLGSGEDMNYIKWYIDNWDEDTVFGNLVLNGPNPITIERCNKLPDNFPVTDEMVGKFLQRGLSLEDEMKGGHMYILNCEDLVGIGRFSKDGDTRFSADAMALFYVRTCGNLVPIAIKLDQEDGPIWTPDDGLGWTLAKLFAKNADVQIHQVGSHLLGTHFVGEPVAMAMLRNLPSVHPLYKLILPHTRHTLAINAVAREKLIQPGGIVDKTLSISDGHHLEVMKTRYRKRFQWTNLNIPQEFANRGVDDADLLPNYHYRDDALLLWSAILQYSKHMVSIFYTTDSDVAADEELQNFMMELHTYGFPFVEGGIDKQCPDSIRTVDELSTTMAMIIFNCSCQHAAVNFGQFHHMAFPPAYPMALRKPPPERKREVQMEDIMATLPDHILTAAAVTITHALTRFIDTEVLLGSFPEELFAEEEAKLGQAKFRQNLAQISKTIHARNEKKEFEYLYLLPERIPCSVAL